MHRIDHATATGSLPTPAAAGTPGYFQDGNPGLGTPATVVTRDWANAVQEELVGPVVAMGVSLDKTVNDQLFKALKRLFGGNVSTITTTGALTADSAGVVRVSAAGGNVTLTLPATNAANGKRLPFIILRTDTTLANAVTVQRAGSDTIQGGTSVAVPVRGVLFLEGDGVSNWDVVRADTAPARTVLTAAGSGSVTVPLTARRALCRVWGAGGGGQTGPGGSGGGGGYSESIIAVTPGGSISYTVGAGGSPATHPTVSGNGGSSSISHNGQSVAANGGGGVNGGFGVGANTTGASGDIKIVGSNGIDLVATGGSTDVALGGASYGFMPGHVSGTPTWPAGGAATSGGSAWGGGDGRIEILFLE